MSGFQLLHFLPKELLDDVLSRLEQPDLGRLNLACQWLYTVGAPFVWREVTLTDYSAPRGPGEIDDHDDTPMLRKLLILATKPWIGSLVQTVNHRRRSKVSCCPFSMPLCY